MANVENPYQIALENNLVVTTNTIIENLPYRNYITVKFEDIGDLDTDMMYVGVGYTGSTNMGEIIKTYSEDNLTFSVMAIADNEVETSAKIRYLDEDSPFELKYYFSYDKDDKENTLLWYGEVENTNLRFAMYQPTNINYLINKIYNNIDNPITIVFDYKLYPDLPEYILSTNFSFLTPYQNDIIDFSNISAENAAYRGILQLNESMILITNATPHPFELSFPKRTSNNTWDLSKPALEYIDTDGFDDTGEPILVDRAKPYLNMNDFYIRTDKLKEVQFMIVEYDVEVQSIGYMAEDTFSILQYLSGNKGYPMFSHTDNLSKTNYFWMGEANQNQYKNPIYCICAHDKDSVKHFPTKIKFSNIIE